jgi:hypothetical protein
VSLRRPERQYLGPSFEEASPAVLAFAENLHASESATNPIEAANFFGQLYRDLQEAARKPND